MVGVLFATDELCMSSFQLVGVILIILGTSVRLFGEGTRGLACCMRLNATRASCTTVASIMGIYFYKGLDRWKCSNLSAKVNRPR